MSMVYPMYKYMGESRSGLWVASTVKCIRIELQLMRTSVLAFEPDWAGFAVIAADTRVAFAHTDRARVTFPVPHSGCAHLHA